MKSASSSRVGTYQHVRLSQQLTCPTFVTAGRELGSTLKRYLRHRKRLNLCHIDLTNVLYRYIDWNSLDELPPLSTTQVYTARTEPQQRSRLHNGGRNFATEAKQQRQAGAPGRSSCWKGILSSTVCAVRCRG